MQTQNHTRSKSSFHPSLAAKRQPAKARTIKAAGKAVVVKPVAAVRVISPAPVLRFRIVKSRDGFYVGQVVHQFNGPTYDIDVPGEILVTVTPNVIPFVGIPPEDLERID